MNQSQPAKAEVARNVPTGRAVGAGVDRRLAVNAAAGSAANFLKIGVQLVMLPVMAHLLGPAEFGLYALALPTISFCMILADGGLAASLAREPLESTLVWSTGFWLILGVGAALSLFVIGWGYALAILAREPRVSGLMTLLSVSLLMISLGALPTARLTREARLTIFAGADVISTVTGASVGVSLALIGFGAKSLAAQYVAYYTLRAIILNGEAFVRPRLQFSLSALSGHLSMGSALLGVKMSDFLGRMIENVLYGRAFGAVGLGVYTFANQAPRFICEAASGPVWAALYAFALREPAERLATTQVNLVRLLSSLVFPAAALLSASAPEVLSLILGPKWAEAGDLLRLLIPFYALNVVCAQTGAVLIARGRGWTLFWLSLGLTLGRVGAVAAGPIVGQRGVAVGVDIALALFSLAMISTTGHPGGARRLSAAAAPASAAAAIAGAACFVTIRLAGTNLLPIVLAWAVGGAAYLVVLAALQWRRIRADLQALGSMLGRSRSPRPAGSTT